MTIKNNVVNGTALRSLALAALVLFTANACSRPALQPAFSRVPKGQSTTGFLSSYDNLQPNPRFENARSYVSTNPARNIHGYVAVIVDNPVVYVGSDVPADAIPLRAVTSLKAYFHDAIDNAVEDAFPVVQASGPLVLRLRSAIVGVDAGQPTPVNSNDSGTDRVLNMGKVGVEMELVDSVTGEQIAAVVDHQNLGEGAVVGPDTFAHREESRMVTDAFDGWASRLREFLDSAHELSADDIKRVEQENFPYASGGNPAR